MLCLRQPVQLQRAGCPNEEPLAAGACLDNPAAPHNAKLRPRRHVFSRGGPLSIGALLDRDPCRMREERAGTVTQWEIFDKYMADIELAKVGQFSALLSV